MPYDITKPSNAITRRQFGALTALSALAVTRTVYAELQGPVITKLGTIDVDLVETTPVVFQGKVYRYEYVREKYKKNTMGTSYSRFIDHETGEATPAFAQGYHLGSAAVMGDLAIVTAVDIWDGEKVEVFVSRDLKTWESWTALNLPGYGMFNTSLCRDPEGYVLMFEVGKPAEVAGNRFTARFARSKDLKTWTLTAPECTYAKDRYTAPHCLRYLDEYYYNFYLESMKGGYAQSVVRSKDLIHWEQTQIHPFLMWSDEDRRIANPKLTTAQRKHIAEAENRNNSDFDYCEFEDKLIINYSWGNQRGLEFLAEARYDGTEKEFLAALFSPTLQAGEDSAAEAAFVQAMLKKKVRCPGEYGGHQQGMATDRKTAIFWSHTVALAKTDLKGNLLKVIDVPNHSGDLAYHDGKVYVATNLGDFNREGGKRDSWIYVYDAGDLTLLGKHPVNEVEFGAGGIAWHNRRFIVIGGLPKTHQQNYVYEYDENFKFLKRHVLPTGHTAVGIQSAAYHDGYWWFGCYGLPTNAGLLQVDKSFNLVETYDLNFAWGIIGLEGKTLMQGGERGSAKAIALKPSNVFKQKSDDGE